MDRGTYERALHLWPEWRHSIEKSRLELGYDASWPVRGGGGLDRGQLFQQDIAPNSG